MLYAETPGGGSMRIAARNTIRWSTNLSLHVRSGPADERIELLRREEGRSTFSFDEENPWFQPFSEDAAVHAAWATWGGHLSCSVTIRGVQLTPTRLSSGSAVRRTAHEMSSLAMADAGAAGYVTLDASTQQSFDGFLLYWFVVDGAATWWVEAPDETSRDHIGAEPTRGTWSFFRPSIYYGGAIDALTAITIPHELG